MSSFIISIFLARLLSPEQFGVVGIAVVFIALTQVFIDVGFTDGLIQRQKMPDSLFSSVFFINLAISLLLATGLFIVAPLVGEFYNDREVTMVLRYLSIVPVIAALGKVHAAVLTKRMDFKSLTIRDIAATTIGGILGVIAAYNGMGVYSLVIQQVSFAFVGTILLWIGSGWRPRLQFEFKEVYSLMGFSIFVFLDQIFRRVFQKLDTLFIGKVFSPASLGFYARAESLNSQVMDYSSRSLRKIMFPVFSSIQDDDVRFKEVYFKAFNLAAVIAVSLAGVLYFLGEEIIIGLYGEKWRPSVILFQILVFRNILTPFGSLMGKAMLSKGYARIKFQVSVLQRIILLSPMLFGLFYGLEAFACAVVGAAAVGLIINTLVVSTYLGFDFFYQINQILLLLIPIGIIKLLTYFSIIPDNPWIQVGIYCVLQWTLLISSHNQGYILLRGEFFRIKTRFTMLARR